MHPLTDQLLAIAKAIACGDMPEFHCETCFTVGAYDLLLINVRGAEAFQLLGDLCAQFDQIQKAEDDVTAYYALLAQVAQMTDTTEMPPRMQAIILMHPTLSGPLRAWYRIRS